MAASVTVHHKAFGDSRIVYLGTLLGCDDDAALGRITRLWSVCTERQTQTPEAHEIRACLRHPKGDELLVEAGLGERLESGAVRVRGCTGMIEWFGEQPAQQREAGRKRAAGARRDAKGRLLPADGGDPQHAGSSGPADPQRSPAQDPDPDLHALPDLSGPGSEPEALPPEPPNEISREIPYVVDTAPQPTPEHLVVAAPARTREDRRRKLFLDAWQFAALKHTELRAAGVDPHARPCWSGLPAADAVESQALFSRIDELAIGDNPDWKSAGERIKNRILVAAAEAKKHGHLRYFTPMAMWRAESFAIAAALSPAQVALSVVRGGAPRDPPPTTPAPKRMKTL